LIPALNQRLRARFVAELPAAVAEEIGVVASVELERGMDVLRVRTTVHENDLGRAAKLIFAELESFAATLSAEELTFAKQRYTHELAGSTLGELAFAIARRDALGQPLTWVTEPEAQLATFDLAAARTLARSAIRPDAAIVLAAGNPLRTIPALKPLGRVQALGLTER
jgi:hypothetical protein